MLRGRTARVAILAVLAAGTAQAASFDCRKAQSFQEEAICDDPALSELDDRLAAAYAAALRSAPQPEALRAEQRQWMAQRNRCRDRACLADAYASRTAALGRAQGATTGTYAPAGPNCRQSLGAARAQVLVRQCLQVSPATHPPCNDQNPCDLITGEIARGCGMLSAGVPSFCHLYPAPQ